MKKKTRNIVLIISGIGLIINITILFLIDFPSQEDTRKIILSIASIVLLVVIGLSLFLFCYQKRYQKRNHYLRSLNECRIEKYIRECKKKLEEVEQSKNLFRYICVKLNLACGYLTYGNFEEAMRLLDELDLDMQGVKQKKSLWTVRLIQADHYFHLYLYQQDWNKAYNFKNSMEEIFRMEKRELSPKEQNHIEAYQRSELVRVNYEWAISQGEVTPEMQNYFEITFLNERNSQHQKVGSAYNLSQIYHICGEIEKEKIYLEYVAQNGNDMFLAKKAREQLQQKHAKDSDNQEKPL